MGELQKTALGSGKLYCAEFANDTIPAFDTIAVDANILGYIKGGASVEYTTESFDDSDDLGYVKIAMITKEDVKLKTGIMTWNGETLTRLCATGRTTIANGIRTTKIGGLGNQTNKSYVLLFVHDDDVNGATRLWIVVKNTSGFTFDYKPDSTTVLETTFTALAQDSEGTLVKIDEILPLELGTTVAGFDKKVDATGNVDITSTINLGVTSIKNGAAALTVTTHYTVADGVLTIKKDYLSTLSVGQIALVVEAENGFKSTIYVTATDSTT